MHTQVVDGHGKIAVIVALESKGDKEVLATLARQIAMHVASANPLALDASGLDPATVEREKKLLAEKNAGKPENVLEKIIEFGPQDLLQGGLLLDQVSNHPDHGGKTVAQAVKEHRRQGRRADRHQGLRALRARRRHRETDERLRRGSRGGRQGLSFLPLNIAGPERMLRPFAFCDGFLLKHSPSRRVSPHRRWTAGDGRWLRRNRRSPKRSRNRFRVNGVDNAAAPPAMPVLDLRDPRELYPQPPFDKQPQPWPGLAGKMTPRPSIINTASIIAFDPSKQLLDYSATKAAILNFTWRLAAQLASKGIRVNAVAPGPFWTPLQPSGGQTQDHLTKFGADTPLGRPGQPAELAPLYVLLASSESSFCTGQVFGATGGEVGP